MFHTTPLMWECFVLFSSTVESACWDSMDAGICSEFECGAKEIFQSMTSGWICLWPCPLSSKLGLTQAPSSGRRPELLGSSLSWTEKLSNVSKNYGSCLDTQHQKLPWTIKEKVQPIAITGVCSLKVTTWGGMHKGLILKEKASQKNIFL